jgi:hypothetical protein
MGLLGIQMNIIVQFCNFDWHNKKANFNLKTVSKFVLDKFVDFGQLTGP